MNILLGLLAGIAGGSFCFWQGYRTGKGRGYADAWEDKIFLIERGEFVRATCDCRECQEMRARQESEVS